MQFLPLGFWGYRYDEGIGKEYAMKIDRTIKDIGQPTVICGDFSGEFTDFRPSLTMDSLNERAFIDCLPQDTRTCPTTDGLIHRNDHIYCTKGYFKVVKAAVLETPTDHYLCVVTLETIDDIQPLI